MRPIETTGLEWNGEWKQWPRNRWLVVAFDSVSPLGISREEVRDTGKVLPITDEGAHLDENNKIVWGSGDGEDLPPIYEEKIHY